MNDNAKKWVAALRSGKYKQGSGGLKSGSSYCCLGVACAISKQGVFVKTSDPYYAYDVSDGYLRTSVLPKKVVDWLGVKTSAPIAAGKNLVYLNDSCKMSFSEIADFIEKNQEEIFV
jgi:hypothetical protein